MQKINLKKLISNKLLLVILGFSLHTPSLVMARTSTKELFLCSLSTRLPSSGRYLINQKNIPVYIAYTNNKYDLQPVFVNDRINKIFMSQVRFMANVFIDEITNQPKLIIGAYMMAQIIRSGVPKGTYWVPSQGVYKNIYHALPIAENITNSDSAEVMTSNFVNRHEVKFSCRRSDI